MTIKLTKERAKKQWREVVEEDMRRELQKEETEIREHWSRGSGKRLTPASKNHVVPYFEMKVDDDDERIQTMTILFNPGEFKNKALFSQFSDYFVDDLFIFLFLSLYLSS